MCTSYRLTGRPPFHAEPHARTAPRLDAALLAQAEAAGRFLELPADSVLWHDEMDAFPGGLLCDGIVRQQRYERDGQRRIANLILPGEVMTARSLARSGYALEAATPVRLLRLPSGAFDGPHARLPGLRDAAYRAFQSQLDRLRWLTWAILALNTEARLCAFLEGADTMLPVDTTDSDHPLIHLALRRRDIADLLSTSVESVCRVLKRLERDGVIRMHGPARVEVRDRAALQLRARQAAPAHPAGASEAEERVAIRKTARG
jgi:CRP/FNR family transcriptional regulator